VRLTANQVRSGNGATVLELRDNASRAGLRGTEDIGGGLQALYGVEAGLNADDGTLTSPALRNAYVGLGGGWGKLALGRLDSANPTGSPLYSQAVAIVSFAANDAGATAIGTSILNARNRTSNAVGYLSPEWGGVSIAGRYYLRGAGTSAETEDAARSIDLGLNYGNGPLKLAFGYGKDSRMGGLKAKEFDWKWQAGARYSLGLVEPYVLLGADHFVPTATTRGSVGFALVGAALRLDPHTVVLNVMERQVQASLNGTRKREQLAYLYRLSKRTELQAFIDNDDTDSSKSGVTIRAIGLGMRHDF
jgi:predicted porin